MFVGPIVLEKLKCTYACAHVQTESCFIYIYTMGSALSNYIFLFQHDKWNTEEIRWYNTESNKSYTKVCCNIKHDV